MDPQEFDLDRVLIRFSDNRGRSDFRIRDAVTGLQIFGGVGAGKTSAAKIFAIKYLQNQFGGLVLTAKAEEKDLWIDYCKETGRSDDLIIVSPTADKRHYFNFLDYESSHKIDGLTLTDNIVQVLKTVIKASEEKSGNGNTDAFWETSLDMLIYNVIDLCAMAYDGRVSVEQMYNIVLSAPKPGDTISEPPKPNSFGHAFILAREKVKAQEKALIESLSIEERKLLSDAVYYEALVIEKTKDGGNFRLLAEFFFEHYRNLSSRTRSVLDFMFSGFLFRLLKEPVYSLFCRHASTFSPTDSLQGKIILLDLPVKQYHKVGRDCQILFKFIWQRAMERRDVSKNDRPVFLWADENQHFIHEHDSEYQATARGYRVCTVAISQNIPNYHACMGGQKSDYRVRGFLATIGNKLFFSNADIETNNFASELIGSGYVEDRTRSSTVAEKFSFTHGMSYKLERMFRPEEFTISLRTGGPYNGFLVDGIMHRQNSPFHTGMSYHKITFKQNL